MIMKIISANDAQAINFTTGTTVIGKRQATDGSAAELVQIWLPDETEIDTATANKLKAQRLKEELGVTDYQVIKCMEYSLAGLEMPYDIATLHDQRQQLRDEINRLESEC